MALQAPRGVAVDDGRVYVSDTGHHRLLLFGNGDPSAIGGYGDEPGRLNQPEGLAVGPGGHIFVADNRNDRVQVFSPSGQLLTTLGHRGSGAGELWSPGGVTVDRQGIVYVADTGNNRVQVFAPLRSRVYLPVGLRP